MTGFRAEDPEILGASDPIGNGSIELGVVTSDGNEYHDAGDADVNDGNPLVQVRLLRGGHSEEEQHRVWCRIDSRIYNLPADGDQVVVAVPAVYGFTPGAPVIIAVTKPNPKPLPALKPEEPVMMGPARNFVRLHSDGKISLFTTDDGTETGKSVYAQVRPDGFRFVHPYGRLLLDKTGFHVLHSSGARVDLGAISGMPTPLDALGSYAKVSAATVHVEGAAVTLGTASGTQDQLAHATPTLACLSSIATALSAIAAAFATLSTAAAPGPTVVAPTQAAALASAISAASSAISAAAATLPTNSTTAD